MATLIDPDFRARLRALNDKYAAGVPALLDAIGRGLARCQADGLSADTGAALHTALHAVAGSAGTVGFGALGAECRSLEHALRSLLDGLAEGLQAQPNAHADVAGWPALARQVEDLLRRAASDPKDLAPPATAALHV